MQSLAQLQVEHLSRLIDDLLDASRIVRGTLDVLPKPIELEVLQRWIERCRDDAATKASP